MSDNFDDFLKEISKDFKTFMDEEMEERKGVLKDASRILDRDDDYAKKVNQVFTQKGVVGALKHFYMVSESNDDMMEGFVQSFKLGAYLGIISEERRRKRIDLSSTFDQLDQILKETKDGRDGGVKSS